MAGVAGLVSAGVGLYGALSGHDTASNVQLPPQFNMPNMTNAANNAYSGINNLTGTGVPNQTAPLYQQTALGQYNNPYADMYLAGAQTAGNMGQFAGEQGFSAGRTAMDTGNTFQTAARSVIPYAGAIANTAFDPQNALYAKTQHDLIDQTRAAQAARGVATTPYGAAGESDTLRKFDIDWQNNQLGRQVTGGNAAAGMINSAGNTGNTGANTANAGAALETGGAATYANASGLPYSTYGNIGTGQFGALNNWQTGAQGGQQLQLNPVQAYLQYLGVGNQAGGVANQGAQIGLNQAGMAFNQNQTLGSNLGSSIAGLGNAYKTGMPGASSGWNWLNSGGGFPGGSLTA